MIYDEPKFLPGGDRYMLIEFGNEMNLELNFTAQGLAGAFAREKTKGVVETAPCFASMLIHYEPEEISFNDLKRETIRLMESLGPSDDLVLDSRLFCFPTVYLDPWTKECVADYIEKIAKKTPDPEFITELNGLADVQQFVRVHSGTEYWVAALGFWPGLPFMMPLDPRCKLTAPKYIQCRRRHSGSWGSLSPAIFITSKQSAWNRRRRWRAICARFAAKIQLSNPLGV